MSEVLLRSTSPATTPSPSRTSRAVPRNSPVRAARSGGPSMALDPLAMDNLVGRQIAGASLSGGHHPLRSGAMRQRSEVGPVASGIGSRDGVRPPTALAGG